MAKRRNVSGRVLRNAVPQPKDVAEFVAPRTVNEGLSIKNVFGDIGDMIDPFITAAIEKQEGLRDVSDDELKMLAALGSIPVAGAIGGKVLKRLNKLVPNPKGGFITVKKGDKLKDILQELKDKGQGLSPEQEATLREGIGYFTELHNAIRAGNQRKADQARRKISPFFNKVENDPELKQAFAAYGVSKGDHSIGGIMESIFNTFAKPEGFDTWPAKDRINYIETVAKESDVSNTSSREANKFKNLKDNPLYKDHYDYGVIHDKAIRMDDYYKAKSDLAAQEAAEATARPIETTQVQELSTGILPSEASVSQGGTRPTYDHSRQFMDTELKQVPGIDRTGMSYGDETDAFYDIYKAWRDAKQYNPEFNAYAGHDIGGQEALLSLLKEAKEGKKRATPAIKQVDPYYAAGIVGDENKHLWDRIDFLRKRGKSDTEIREILKKDLDKYQGSIERFKERMPSKGHGASFYYDGADTRTFKATPSEEIRALKALGIDTPEYDELERLGNFYRVFFPK